MSTDDPLNAYGAQFYQGIADDVSDMKELARRALKFMSPEQRDALRAYLQDALDRLTPSELKGKVNRAIREYGFNRSQPSLSFARQPINSNSMCRSALPPNSRRLASLKLT
ncbi:hypothetical protein [Sphingomonas antarctica]|uniref:hypothetical protein n=1 Tax=Sphingomonas antarctica TaxID=2040274 RepID=UPI0039ED3587